MKSTNYFSHLMFKHPVCLFVNLTFFFLVTNAKGSYIYFLKSTLFIYEHSKMKVLCRSTFSRRHSSQNRVMSFRFIVCKSLATKASSARLILKTITKTLIVAWSPSKIMIGNSISPQKLAWGGFLFHAKKKRRWKKRKKNGQNCYRVLNR